MSLWPSFLIETSKLIKLISMYTHYIYIYILSIYSILGFCIGFPRSFPVLRVRARSFGKQRERWADRRWGFHGQMPNSPGPNTQRLIALVKIIEWGYEVILYWSSLIKHAKPHWENMYKSYIKCISNDRVLSVEIIEQTAFSCNKQTIESWQCWLSQY